jgi:hypothetical protein
MSAAQTPFIAPPTQHRRSRAEIGSTGMSSFNFFKRLRAMKKAAPVAAPAVVAPTPAAPTVPAAQMLPIPMTKPTPVIPQQETTPYSPLKQFPGTTWKGSEYWKPVPKPGTGWK